MKTSHLKFKIFKIIHPTLKTLVFTLLVGVVFTSCNDKKEASVKDKKEKVKVTDTKKEKVADADHSFDISLVKGSETIEFSEDIPSGEGNALYNDQKMATGKDNDRNRTVMMSIGKNYNRGKAGVFGIFRVDENWKLITDMDDDVKNASKLWIRPEDKGDEFSSISGTLTFSDLKYVLPMPNHGAACFKLRFEGDFQKNGNKKDIYQGSGTIVLSPKRDMGTYKKK